MCLKSYFCREFCCYIFFLKKSAAKAHRILRETYRDHALDESSLRNWYRHFKNSDFDLKDKECAGAPKKFEDEELKVLLLEDPCQTLAELAESLRFFDSSAKAIKKRTI